jgi:hypothetical protein
MQRSATVVPFQHPRAQPVIQNHGTKNAGKVRPAFAPVQTRAATRPPAAAGRFRRDIHFAKQPVSGRRHNGTVRCQLDRAQRNQPVCNSDAEFAGDGKRATRSDRLDTIEGWSGDLANAPNIGISAAHRPLAMRLQPGRLGAMPEHGIGVFLLALRHRRV